MPDQRGKKLFHIPVGNLVMSISFVPRRVTFYENGIHFPQDYEDGNRFIAWSQIARFYWEGDVLTVVPGASFLSGYGSGRPLAGGCVQVPTERRQQVENLLSVVQPSDT